MVLRVAQLKVAVRDRCAQRDPGAQAERLRRFEDLLALFEPSEFRFGDTSAAQQFRSRAIDSELMPASTGRDATSVWVPAGDRRAAHDPTSTSAALALLQGVA